MSAEVNENKQHHSYTARTHAHKHTLSRNDHVTIMMSEEAKNGKKRPFEDPNSAKKKSFHVKL